MADALKLWVREKIATGKIDQEKLDSYTDEKAQPLVTGFEPFYFQT